MHIYTNAQIYIYLYSHIYIYIYKYLNKKSVLYGTVVKNINSEARMPACILILPFPISSYVNFYK